MPTVSPVRVKFPELLVVSDADPAVTVTPASPDPLTVISPVMLYVWAMGVKLIPVTLAPFMFTDVLLGEKEYPVRLGVTV